MVPPLLLDYASSVGRAVVLAPLARRRIEAIKAHWRDHRTGVIVIAVFNPLAYILVLTALSFTPVAYVAPLREVSVLLTVLAGSLLLGEGRLGATAWLGNSDSCRHGGFGHGVRWGRSGASTSRLSRQPMPMKPPGLVGPEPSVEPVAGDQVLMRTDLRQLRPLDRERQCGPCGRWSTGDGQWRSPSCLPSAHRGYRSRAVSISESRAEVASSSTRIGASFKMARARAMRWRWPPDRRMPRSPTMASYPLLPSRSTSCGDEAIGRLGLAGGRHDLLWADAGCGHNRYCRPPSG